MSLLSTELTDILSFWFDEAGPKKWFAVSDAFDAGIRARFEAVSIRIAAHKTLSINSPKTGLAVIIALDQFSRNMYRGTAAAFAWDHKALSYAEIMTEKGWDLKLTQSERSFVYMPYMHAEDRAMQAKSVELVDRYLDDANTLFHAKAHQKLIEQFGRFPHRNDILRRTSTEEEQAYLREGGYRP